MLVIPQLHGCLQDWIRGGSTLKTRSDPPVFWRLTYQHTLQHTSHIQTQILFIELIIILRNYPPFKTLLCYKLAFHARSEEILNMLNTSNQWSYLVIFWACGSRMLSTKRARSRSLVPIKLTCKRVSLILVSMNLDSTQTNFLLSVSVKYKNVSIIAC